MEVWKNISGKEREKISTWYDDEVKGKTVFSLFMIWWLINTNHHNLHLCCFSPNLRYNRIFLKQHYRGVVGNLCSMFSHPVISCDRGGLGILTKSLLDHAKGSDFTKKMLILFPTFQASPVLPTFIIRLVPFFFPKNTLEAASGNHSCGYQEL